MADDRERLLLRLHAAVQQLARAVVGHVPTEAQATIEDVLMKLIEMRRDYKGGA